MPDFSPPTPEELAALKNDKFAPPTAEELALLKPKSEADQTQEQISKYLGKAQDLSQPAIDLVKKLASPVTNSLEWVSKKLDPYTGAPLRAGVGELEQGRGLASAGQKAYEQLVSGKILPTTPTGEDLAYKGMTSAGVNPAFAKPTASAMGPMVGGMLDATNILGLGDGIATKAVTKAPGALKTIGDIGAQGLMKVGESMSGLDYGKSLKATRNLSGLEQLAPKLSGASEKAYTALNDLRKANSAEPVVVPGSGYGVAPAIDVLNEAKTKPLNAPNVQTMIDKLQGMIDSGSGAMSDIGEYHPIPKDLTVSQLDNLLQNSDELSYTPFGNQRAVKAQLKPAMGETRNILTSQLASTPEGQALLDARSKSADVLTAQKGGSNSKLMQALNKSSVLKAPWNPRTYHAIAGAAKIPSDIGGAVLSHILDSAPAEAISSFAQTNPKTAEFLLRSGALAPGRKNNSSSPWLKLNSGDNQ